MQVPRIVVLNMWHLKHEIKATKEFNNYCFLQWIFMHKMKILDFLLMYFYFIETTAVALIFSTTFGANCKLQNTYCTSCAWAKIRVKKVKKNQKRFGLHFIKLLEINWILQSPSIWACVHAWLDFLKSNTFRRFYINPPNSSNRINGDVVVQNYRWWLLFCG